MNNYKKLLDLRIAFLEKTINLREILFLDGEAFTVISGHFIDYKTCYLRLTNKNSKDGLDLWFYYNENSKLKPLHINLVELDGAEVSTDDLIETDVESIIQDYEIGR